MKLFTTSDPTLLFANKLSHQKTAEQNSGGHHLSAASTGKQGVSREAEAQRGSRGHKSAAGYTALAGPSTGLRLSLWIQTTHTLTH